MTSCPFSDPSRIWEDLAVARDTPGLFWSEQMRRWVVSRHDDLVTALHDPDTFSSAPTVPELPPEIAGLFDGKVPVRGTLIGHDNPTHDRLRAAVNTFFMPRRVARYEKWIEAQAHALIDDFYEEGELDFRARFTAILPLKVISRLAGFDPDRSDFYLEALHAFSGLTPRLDLIMAFHEEAAAAIEKRRHRRGDDLMSHVWNLRDSGEAVMTDFEMLSLFPGLMVAGHETSANLIVMALAHMFARPGAYEAAQRDDASRARAIEEALRFEAPILGMPRRATRPVTLGGTELRAGDEVFLAYGSANRDARYYPDAETFDVERTGTQQHIGFGQGIHACLGAPLARLLLKVELRVIADRLPGLRLATPYEARQYGPVSEFRGMVDSVFAWDVRDEYRARKGSHPAPGDIADGQDGIAAHVAELRLVARDVVELVIAADVDDLPQWAPGAHAEIALPNGLVRQYSLCGPAAEGGRWTVAVSLDPESRGGSRYIHESLAEGASVVVKSPRNHFPLVGDGPKLFIAGGIGVTPMLRMWETVAARGDAAQFVYLGRTLDTMPYRQRLEAARAGAVTIHASETGRFDLEALLTAAAPGTIVYCCGPARLLTAVEGLCDALGLACRVERFAPAVHDDNPNTPFDAELASTGERLHVPADETLLSVLAARGIAVQSTCQEGTCGTCEIGVLEGEVLHRDSVLTREERAANTSMMACVSRCAGKRLLLQL